MAKRWRKNENSVRSYFLGPRHHCGWWLTWNEKMLVPWKESYDKPRHHFASKGPYSQSYGFSTSHVQIWELYHKEGWVMNNWCFWTVVLEKTLQSPLDSKEMKPVNPKGNPRWIFTGKTDAEAEAPILWPPDAKNRLTGKDPDAGKDCGGWTAPPTQWTWAWANSGDSEGQGSLVCCSPQGCKESDMA